MKFDGEKTAEENRLRWLRHAEERGSPALSAPPSSAHFAALELNRHLKALEARILAEIVPIATGLARRKGDPGDALEDWEISLMLSYSLGTTDPEWQAFDDNLLYVQSQSLYEVTGLGLHEGFGLSVAGHPWEQWLGATPCWTFLDLLENTGLDWDDVARIAAVAVSLSVQTDERPSPLPTAGACRA